MNVHLPRYFIGKLAHFEDIKSGAHVIGSEFHAIAPDGHGDPEHFTLNILLGEGVPHPGWVELPHLLDPQPVAKYLKNRAEPHVIAALAHPWTGITPQDTTFSLVMKWHAKHPVFKP
ncbi:MAG: hypothetical protein ACRDHZ_00540 [Ktedonobacteraceae bacterium]